MNIVSAACSPDETRAALQAVLASRSFDRSDQLKRFLRYVCDMELAGKADELTEYLIGVEALGRPESFSPNEDSIVRNRAYAVRRKLEEYYREEAPGAEGENIQAVQESPGISQRRIGCGRGFVDWGEKVNGRASLGL